MTDELEDIGVEERGVSTVDLFHFEEGIAFHSRDVRAILQPCGLYYNRELRELRSGDRLRFLNGVEGEVVDVTDVDMTQPLFATLVRWIYGEDFRSANVVERWIEHAVRQGNGKSAVSMRKCLLIRYRIASGVKKR